MSLKESVSGVRGIWAESLTMDVVFSYARAFACMVLERGGTKILLGRDGRPTGEAMTRMVSSILNMMGLDTADAGIVPTPTVLYGVRECGFDAGIIFSASHNPLQWNAFKFVKEGGVFTDEEDLALIQKYRKHPLPQPSWAEMGRSVEDTKVLDAHLKAVAGNVNASLIQTSGIKVLLDPVNASGCIATKKLFDLLGIEAVCINDEPHGHFAHPAEPIPAHLGHLKDEVRKVKADVAFAQDPDADRLVLADEKGVVLSEELTGVLALAALLARGEKGSLVLNMSTSAAAEKLNKGAVRSKVGEAHVVKKMAEVQAFYGIEGNGGVIYPKVNAARDSLVGIALILEYMAREKKPLSALAAALPPCVMIKEKFDFSGSLVSLFASMKTLFPNAKDNSEDGLRLDLPSGAWIHLRSSNTEPIVRLIAEAETQEEAQALVEKVKALF